MSNISQIKLYKNRSYLSCITETLNIFAHNLRTIVSYTWPSALAVAVLQSFSFSAATSICINAITTRNATFLAISFMLSILAQVLLYSQALGLVNCQKMSYNIKKVIRLILTCMAFWILITIILTAMANMVGLVNDTSEAPQAISLIAVVIYAIYIIIGLLVLPYIYVFTKYIMEPESKLLTLLYASYKAGLRHWGLIFTTILLTYLCMVVCVMVLALPAVIIISARITSINGVMLLGDPSGLPSYFDFMQFGFFVFANFIWSYISVFFMFVCFFVYGSIETREKEKMKFLNDIGNSKDQYSKSSK